MKAKGENEADNERRQLKWNEIKQNGVKFLIRGRDQRKIT